MILYISIELDHFELEIEDAKYIIEFLVTSIEEYKLEEVIEQLF